jgi:hypothetical protein
MRALLHRLRGFFEAHGERAHRGRPEALAARSAASDLSGAGGPRRRGAALSQACWNGLAALWNIR